VKLTDKVNLPDFTPTHAKFRGRSGVQSIDFLRTTSSESFGDNGCADWKVTTNSGCGLDIYRKATHPTLGQLYNGNVIEFDADGDVMVNKAGGLKVGGVDVATETFVTDIADTFDNSVSQLVTASTGHGSRITAIEDAGYATQSSLSIYATATSLGTTNTNLSGVGDRVTTLGDAGYITTPALQAY